jgi:putative endonuclease
MTQARAEAGVAAELLAERFLRSRGLTIVARNYRSRGGEIDLVCGDGTMLVFVEVRLRRSSSFGGAAASVTQSKQRRIILAARHYLAGKLERPCRFDVIVLDALDEAHIEWIRDAFVAD